MVRTMMITTTMIVAVAVVLMLPYHAGLVFSLLNSFADHHLQLRTNEDERRREKEQETKEKSEKRNEPHSDRYTSRIGTADVRINGVGGNVYLVSGTVLIFVVCDSVCIACVVFESTGECFGSSCI